MNFAALEAAANVAVLRHLANAQVGVAGATVPGIFDCPSTVVDLGMGAADVSPTVKVASSALPADPVEQEITINGVPYVVITASPDGTGMTVLTVGRTQ